MNAKQLEIKLKEIVKSISNKGKNEFLKNLKEINKKSIPVHKNGQGYIVFIR